VRYEAGAEIQDGKAADAVLGKQEVIRIDHRRRRDRRLHARADLHPLGAANPGIIALQSHQTRVQAASRMAESFGQRHAAAIGAQLRQTDAATAQQHLIATPIAAVSRAG
jgi:predicted SpoU family rRNA methylase